MKYQRYYKCINPKCKNRSIFYGRKDMNASFTLITVTGLFTFLRFYYFPSKFKYRFPMLIHQFISNTIMSSNNDKAIICSLLRRTKKRIKNCYRQPLFSV